MRSYSPGDEPIPGYRLIEQLGQGSFGVVWQAEGPGGVLVAMKIISNLNGIHAIREWQSLQNVMNLKQANLVEIYGVWLKNEANQVLGADEVRALIPREIDLPAPVTETPSPPPQAPRKAVWAGDKRVTKPAAAPHKLEGATLQPDDDPQTAVPAAGSTAADSSRPGESPSAGTHDSDATKGAGSAQESPSGRNASSAKESAGSGSRGKWSRAGGVPPLELVSAMTLGEGTLMSRLRHCQTQGQRGIPRPELLRYMVEAAKGLAYLNDRKMHHCDVKPENLLLVGGSVKVCDYGSALRTIYSAESRTHQGYTEQYAAPEQLSGRRVKLHPSTDMYALALTYYALRTGKYPWGEVSTEPIAVVKYGEKFDFSALAGQSRYPYEWQVIRKALKREPEQRFSSPLEFVESLENAVRREEDALRARRRRRTRNLALAVMAVVLVGAGVGGWINRDRLPPWMTSWVSVRSQVDEFNSAIVANDVVRAVQIANTAQPPLNRTSVVDGIATALEKIAANPEQVKQALDNVLTIRSEYRPDLRDAVRKVSITHYQTDFSEPIAKGEFSRVLEAVEQNQGLRDWELADEVRIALIGQWLQDGKSGLAAAARDVKQPAESIAPLAALATALSSESARQVEIDGAVQQQLGGPLADAESSLAKEAELARARDLFRWIATAADRYLQGRSGTAAEIRSQGAIAKVGELAARFRLASDKPADLLKELAAIRDADLQSASLAQARRILLIRALGPADDPELVSDHFLTSELPRLRSLPPGWEQQSLDKIKKAAIDVAQKRQQAGQLANIDAVLKALQDDRFTLQFVRDALAGAAAAKDETAFAAALELARQRLRPLSEKLKQPADEQVKVAVQTWLTLLTSDAPTPGQVTAAVKAFEEWEASAGGDQRAVAWYGDLAQSLARRPKRWPKEALSGAISELESAASTSTSRIDRHLAALALRSQRLLLLAAEPELTSDELMLVEQDSGRLVAAREDEDEGGHIGRFVDPPSLVDAVWAEAQLVPLALANRAEPAIPPNVKGALERLASYLHSQPAAAADVPLNSYLRYVADLHRAIARPPGDDLADVFAPPAEGNAWLASPRRHAAAAALLLRLAEQAGTVSLTRGVDLSTHGDTFSRQLPYLTRARAWAAAGSSQAIAAAAQTAVALCYAAGDRNWIDILAASQAALADRKACQSAISPQLYSHLLLVHAEALRQQSSSENSSSLVGSLAEVLLRECDPYDGSKGLFEDFDLYEQAALPALTLIADPSAAELKLLPADRAAIYGAAGILLERDTSRRIAHDHYQFNSGPNQYAAALLDSFQKAGQYDEDPQRKLRWLAGEGMARDRQADLMPGDDYSDVVKELESIAGRIEDLDKDFFAGPALRGLAAFYSVPKVNDVADLASGAAQREAALKAFRAAIESLKKHPQAESPWCRTWQATILRLASHICLQQSWNLAWGPTMQDKLQEAIRFAMDARRSAPNKLEEALASSTLGNAYEDMAFYLKCVPFYARAEKEFHSAQDAVKDVDPFQEFLFRRNLVRVQYRRLTHDPTLTDQQRKDWKQKLPADMEQLLADTKTRQLDRYQPFTEYWLADMLATLHGDDIDALTRAEKLYTTIPKDASAQTKAKRYYQAADCAMRLAVLHEKNNEPAKSDEAVNRARRYMEPILSLEKELQEASLRSEIAQLRADIAADRQQPDDLDAQFSQYEAESRRSAGVGGLSPAEATRLQIRLYLMVAASPCKSDQNFGVRQAVILEVFRLLEQRRNLLDDREYVTLLLRAANVAVERAVAYHKKPRSTAFPASELLTMGKQSLEAARDAEKRMGHVECCAAPMETSVGKVAGFDAVWETRNLRLSLAKHLIQPIYASQKSKLERSADLAWIKAQLDELKKALPREGEQAAALRSRIDNDYLRLLTQFLETLKSG